ncbi:hypothetical protein RFI_30584 [Reticulomyxa filosa]|uniref:Uncharacterized protein n=1 Tax=Reticulomyxa filosa TaxID=46433 RepID=X6LY09_RETFI|nr:hypothetical protein RFI_30584 [Reticulomyxa filosa]|eukprot:ETO06808.1 hypothetical protein RFI_30584 [Reticulomyxa filosa]
MIESIKESTKKKAQSKSESNSKNEPSELSKGLEYLRRLSIKNEENDGVSNNNNNNNNNMHLKPPQSQKTTPTNHATLSTALNSLKSQDKTKKENSKPSGRKSEEIHIQDQPHKSIWKKGVHLYSKEKQNKSKSEQQKEKKDDEDDNDNGDDNDNDNDDDDDDDDDDNEKKEEKEEKEEVNKKKGDLNILMKKIHHRHALLLVE